MAYSVTHLCLIAIEQELLLQCRSIDSALHLFIEYNPKVKDVIQERILGFTDPTVYAAINVS